MMGGGAEPVYCPKCSAEIHADERVCPNCGAAIGDVSRTLTSGFTSILTNEDWQRFAPGNVFANRYTIIEEIGHGGMGRVYKAIDRSLGITVAIKIIRPEYASNPRVVDLFKKETVLARSISSENVVRVHDLGEAENTKYISMDFVEGQNLRDLIHASGSVTISAAVKFGQQICSGLAAAHKEGIIHRDLKPSNVMIDRTGRARVMDFGLAKTIDREGAPGVRSVVGTPEYLSPEQARGEKLDQRTDIYAIGLILYEMVTGRPVFEAETLTGYIKKHCEINPEPPSRWNHMVPAGLDSIILRCLKKDRNERYQTMGEVCRDLSLVVSPEISPPKTFLSFVLRLSGWIAVGAAIAFCIYLLFIRNRGPAVPPISKSVAVMSFENITRDPSQEKWRYTRDILMTGLQASRFLRVVPPEKLRQYMKDLGINDIGDYAQDELDKIASRENVDYFLLGGYAPYGDGCRIEIRLVDAQTHENVNSYSFNIANFEKVQDSCDEISRWTKEALGFSKSDLAKDFDREIGKYTTRSFDALVYFFRGLDFYEQRDFERSSEEYLNALAIDKNFALAYARLALNFTYEGKYGEAKTNIRKAMSLRKKLIPRERLLIEGDFYNVNENDYVRAVGKYETLLREYPDDEMALEHLGAIYRNTEEWEKSGRCYERLQALYPKSLITIRNLSFVAEAMGEYGKAERILQDNRDVFSASEEFQRDLARCLLCQRRTEQALMEIEEPLSLDATGSRNVQFLGHIQTIMGNYGDAESAYKELLEEDRTDSEILGGHYWLEQLYLLRGQFDNCSREIEEGLRLAKEKDLPGEELTFLLLKSDFYMAQEDFARAYETASRARKKAVEIYSREDEVQTLHLMGLSQVGLGQVSEARRTVLAMEQIINKIGYPKLLRSCFHLEGMIAGAGKSWDKAVGAFLKAVETLPRQHSEYLDQQAVYIEALASSLLQRGDLDGAQAQYEKVITLTTGRLTAGDAYARSLFQLGRIYQEKNEPVKAKEFFQKYLEVRSDADAGLEEVEDARKRLAAIS